MTFLEHFVSSSLAGTIGWALLHSLWEGALIASLLAAVMIATRSPRARYIVACAAMIAMFVAFAFSVARLMPDRTQHSQTPQPPRLFWAASPDDASAHSWNFNLSAIAPWLGPFWLAGASLAHSRLAVCPKTPPPRCVRRPGLLAEKAIRSLRTSPNLASRPTGRIVPHRSACRPRSLPFVDPSAARIAYRPSRRSDRSPPASRTRAHPPPRLPREHLAAVG